MKQAAEKAGSADSKKIADVMHSGMTFKTVIGDISGDKKGDITRPDYVMYVWKKVGDKITYVEMQQAGPRSFGKSRPETAAFSVSAVQRSRSVPWLNGMPSPPFSRHSGAKVSSVDS